MKNYTEIIKIEDEIPVVTAMARKQGKKGNFVRADIFMTIADELKGLLNSGKEYASVNIKTGEIIAK